MNPRHPSEDEIFERAVELSGEARASYVAQVCAGDDQLRHRLGKLLAAHEQATGFLENLQAAAARPTVRLTLPPEEQCGERIGRYKLLQKIGEGGCGVVYMAEQEEPVRRRVALKVIKLGMDTKQVVARFEAERQALALMDHPHIAKVLDAGATDTGRPYFVMELVRGIKITDYCDNNNLSTEERLKLFIQVCSAIQHAHQKGIIHRDIKPSNILVTLHDGVPMPKVIDFGIAKATADIRLTDKTLFTAFEQFMGTPDYMSPEQAEMSGLDIDTRSDIYSLGVLLYELLTGQTPLNVNVLWKAGLDAMRKTIREQEPLRPSKRLDTMAEGESTTVANHRQIQVPKLIGVLRGDLDWIVMKALEKDRVRRYENVTAFAQDVYRFLDTEAVTARPPSSFYRFGKLVRRNKLVFAAIVAVTVALLIGLIVSMWLFFKEVKARGQARQRQLLAESQVVRLTGRTSGWSQRAWSLTSEAAKIQTGENSGDVRNQAAASLAGLDAQRVQQFTNFSAASVLFDRAGRRLLMGSLGDGTRLWDGTANAPVVGMNSEPSPVVFVENETAAHLLYDANRNCFTLSDLLTAKPVREWRIPPQLVARMKTGVAPKLLAVSAAGSVAATVLKLSDEKEVVVVFRADLATILHESTTNSSSLTISPDGRLVAIATAGGGVEVWSSTSGQRIAAMTSGRSEILCLALKAVNRTTAAKFQNQETNGVWLLAAGDTGGNVTIYDVQSGQILAHCRVGHYQVYAVAFSPDGNTLASGGRGPVKLWDVATGTLLLDVPTGDYITGLDFSPTGERLAVSSGGIVSVWHLEFGRGIQTLRGLSGQVSKVCLSADGRRLAALSHKWELGVWEVATGQLLRVIEAPEGQFADNAAIALDSTGQQVAFAGGRKAALWNVASGNESSCWNLPDGIVDVLTFTDRGHLLSCRMDSWNQNSRVWRIRDLLNQSADKPLAEIRDFSHVLASTASPDGSCFVVEGWSGGSNKHPRMIKAYEWLTGKELWSVASTKTASWSRLVPDAAGKFIAMQISKSPESILVDTASGNVVKPLPWLPCAIFPRACHALLEGIDFQ